MIRHLVFYKSYSLNFYEGHDFLLSSLIISNFSYVIFQR